VRIVFIGASGFGLRAAEVLEGLADCQLVGVVTVPRKFSISYRPTGVTNILFADLSEFATARDIPFRVLGKGMNDPELFITANNWRPDCFIVVGWYHMVPASWRKIAPAYGLHASLLPDYSGGAPLVWAMINGERRTGVTLFQFDDGVDSGPVIGSLATDIKSDDTIATLYARIEKLGLQLLVNNLPLIAMGAETITHQDENKRRIFPQRSPDDGGIDWNWSAQRILNFVRAQTRPYPGAYTKLDGCRLILWECQIVEVQNVVLTPGQFGKYEENIVAGCGDGRIIELNLVNQFGKDLTAKEWFERTREHRIFDT
jgi:methionyl-tRNA formyltransferase